MRPTRTDTINKATRNADQIEPSFKLTAEDAAERDEDDSTDLLRHTRVANVRAALDRR